MPRRRAAPLLVNDAHKRARRICFAAFVKWPPTRATGRFINSRRFLDELDARGHAGDGFLRSAKTIAADARYMTIFRALNTLPTGYYTKRILV